MTRRRIMVIGPTGSGKTTLSGRLAALLGVPAIEFDALFHKPDWQETPDKEFRAKVTAALDGAPSGWITDGNYSRVRAVTLPRADTVLWLRLPWRISFWRLFKRTLRRAWMKEELWNGNRESWRLAFFSRHSILLWSITHHRAHVRKTRYDFGRIPHTAELIVARSNADVEAFVASLT